MPDAVILAIATAVAGKVTESLTDQARQILAEIRQRIRAKFRDRPDDLAIVEAAQAEPDAPERIDQVARLLEAASCDDPGFGSEIRSLWNQAQIKIAGDGNATNIFHGQADKVVQIRDVHGGLTIN